MKLKDTHIKKRIKKAKPMSFERLNTWHGGNAEREFELSVEIKELRERVDEAIVVGEGKPNERRKYA